MTTRETANPTTVARLLRLNSHPARMLAALFITAEMVKWYTAFPAAFGTLQVSGYASLLVAIGVLLTPGVDPMSTTKAVTVVVAAYVATLLTTVGSPIVEQVLARALWSWGTCTLLMMFLAILGRPFLGWIGGVAISGTYLCWGAVSQQNTGELAFQVMWNLGLLLLGTIFALTIRRQVRSINEIRETGESLAVEFAESSAAMDERNQQLGFLTETTRPALERIRSGEPISDHDKIEYALLEAALRDRIRASTLSTEPIVGLTAAARRAGIRVMLLDDGALRGQPQHLVDTVVAAVAAELRGVTSGQLTARILPPGRAHLATVLTNVAGVGTRLEIDTQGQVERAYSG